MSVRGWWETQESRVLRAETRFNSLEVSVVRFQFCRGSFFSRHLSCGCCTKLEGPSLVLRRSYCNMLPRRLRLKAQPEQQTQHDFKPQRLGGARSHPPSGAQKLGTGSPTVFVLLGVSSVKGVLAEIRWWRRPSVCRKSCQEAEHRGCVSVWEVLQGRARNLRVNEVLRYRQ